MRPRILHLAELDAGEREALCRRGAIDVADYLERAAPIVQAVREEGDGALLRFAAMFDGVDMTAAQIRVGPDAFDAAYDIAPSDAVAAIREAASNIRKVHERQRPPAVDAIEVRPGVTAGDRHAPIESVACYAPRGKGAFPSAALMTAVPAAVAGVPRVAIVTPPGPGGTCDPGTLIAAREAGVEEVYLAGGAQAVAAVAYGTGTIPRCRKIVGPGSPWVGAAMALCSEAIAPGRPAGPSESMVLADGTADPDRLALDLLTEAEHGADSTTFLVVWEAAVAEAAADRIAGFLDRLSEERRAFVSAALGENGGLAVAADRDDALAFVNEFAPEHLQIASARAGDLLDGVVNAGEILLGQNAPFSMANFTIGVNAVLPTGGKAAAHSALGVMDFVKRQSIAELTEEGYESLAGPTEALALYEGFDAHALAIAGRRELGPARSPGGPPALARGGGTGPGDREADRAFHDSLIVIDALEAGAWDRELLEELREGGATAVHVTLAFWEDARAALGNIGRWRRLFEDHGDLVMPVRTAADIERAKRVGKTGVIFGFQNASPIEDDLSLIRTFHELGVRIVQLTYNNQSLLGAGCYETADAGVSRFGREAIREMNRVGMTIDLSHSAELTTLQAIGISERPVAITHANPLSFHEGLRNKSDRVLEALAESGGMLGFSTYPLHIGGSDVSLDAFCGMIADTAELMGVDRIGMGTDMCRKLSSGYLDWMRSGRWSKRVDGGEAGAAGGGWPEWPVWFRSAADLPNITRGLLDKGFSEADAAKIMGGNWLEFFRDGFEPR